MENVNLNNIGIANLIITNKLVNSYINENFNDNDKKILTDFYKLINNSLPLQLEFKIINNIENKYIEDTTLAMRYIDDNIKLFEIYTLDELKSEEKKVGDFISTIENNINKNAINYIVDHEKVNLYENIQILIKESLKFGDDVNVDDIHDAFEFILEHIKTKKDVNKNLKLLNNINEDVINLAINNFNEKYSNILNENELNFLKKIISFNLNDKKILFEQYKNDNLIILNSLKSEMPHQKINESIDKIKKMNFNPNTINKDLIKLYDLQKNL